MARPALPLPDPLLYPLAVLAGGLVLVAGVRVAALGVPVSASAAVLTALLVGEQRRRSERLPGRKPSPAAEAALEQALATALDLAQRSRQLNREASARLGGIEGMEDLAELQLSDQRLQELPDRLRSFGDRLESSGGSQVPVQRLRQRLAEEERRARSASGALQQQRLQLVQQLQANLELARRGHDEREVRALSLTILLESASGELLALQERLRPGAAPGPGEEPTRRLELVLDRLDDLLDGGASDPIA